MLNCCVLLGLDWTEPMMFYLLHITFNSLYSYIDLFGAFLCVSLFLALVCSMAPKYKSTLSQNPLCSGASSSSSPSDPTPSHVRFHDDKARKDFSENFSRRDIHSERQVVLSDFSNTNLPTIIYSRGWESLCHPDHLSFHDHTRVLLQYAHI